MTWQDAFRALHDGDPAALLAYTSSTVRLHPAHLWAHWVGLALWRAAPRLLTMTAADNPDAYVRRVAMRLRRDDEQTVLGRHPVYDATGCRRIGHVTVGSLYAEGGAIIEPVFASEQVQALGFAPSDGVNAIAEAGADARHRRVAAYNAKPMVLAHDDDERAVQSAMRRGISRREMPGFLGWDRRRVERTWKRLYRRRES